MNNVLILLLVTLVQSQSDGVLLSKPTTNDGFQDPRPKERDHSEFSYPINLIRGFEFNIEPESYRKRSITSDAFTRRSALDKNFMRFGRGGNPPQKRCDTIPSEGKLNFYRFGRGSKDSFIRFGRARDNFIRFGRGGGKDGFIRFGRSRPEDFFRAGKSLRENFIRFGKADKNFLRFGREKADENYSDIISLDEPFRTPGKLSQRAQDNFMRFGRNGKNGTNFLRFGKSIGEADVVAEPEESNQDSETMKGEVKRKRRDARKKPPEKISKIEMKRSPEFFETPPEDFPWRVSLTLDGPWENLENSRNLRLTPFFPAVSNFPKSLNFYGAETKRNQGGSNFIRFG